MDNKKIDLYVGCKNSQKGTPYQVLLADLGYTVKYLSFDRAIISEVTGLSLREIGELPVDTRVLVGSIHLK